MSLGRELDRRRLGGDLHLHLMRANGGFFFSSSSSWNREVSVVERVNRKSFWHLEASEGERPRVDSRFSFLSAAKARGLKCVPHLELSHFASEVEGARSEAKFGACPVSRFQLFFYS